MTFWNANFMPCQGEKWKKYYSIAVHKQISCLLDFFSPNFRRERADFRQVLFDTSAARAGGKGWAEISYDNQPQKPVLKSFWVRT